MSDSLRRKSSILKTPKPKPRTPLLDVNILPREEECAGSNTPKTDVTRRVSFAGTNLVKEFYTDFETVWHATAYEEPLLLSSDSSSGAPSDNSSRSSVMLHHCDQQTLLASSISTRTSSSTTVSFQGEDPCDAIIRNYGCQVSSASSGSNEPVRKSRFSFGECEPSNDTKSKLSAEHETNEVFKGKDEVSMIKSFTEPRPGHRNNDDLNTSKIIYSSESVGKEIMQVTGTAPKFIHSQTVSSHSSRHLEVAMPNAVNCQIPATLSEHDGRKETASLFSRKGTELFNEDLMSQKDAQVSLQMSANSSVAKESQVLACTTPCDRYSGSVNSNLPRNNEVSTKSCLRSVMESHSLQAASVDPSIKTIEVVSSVSITTVAPLSSSSKMHVSTESHVNNTDCNAGQKNSIEPACHSIGSSATLPNHLADPPNQVNKVSLLLPDLSTTKASMASPVKTTDVHENSIGVDILVSSTTSPPSLCLNPVDAVTKTVTRLHKNVEVDHSCSVSNTKGVSPIKSVDMSSMSHIKLSSSYTVSSHKTSEAVKDSLSKTNYGDEFTKLASSTMIASPIKLVNFNPENQDNLSSTSTSELAVSSLKPSEAAKSVNETNDGDVEMDFTSPNITISAQPSPINSVSQVGSLSKTTDICESSGVVKRALNQTNYDNEDMEFTRPVKSIINDNFSNQAGASSVKITAADSTIKFLRSADNSPNRTNYVAEEMDFTVPLLPPVVPSVLPPDNSAPKSSGNHANPVLSNISSSVVCSLEVPEGVSSSLHCTMDVSAKTVDASGASTLTCSIAMNEISNANVEMNHTKLVKGILMPTASPFKTSDADAGSVGQSKHVSCTMPAVDITVCNPEGVNHTQHLRKDFTKPVLNNINAAGISSTRNSNDNVNIVCLAKLNSKAVTIGVPLQDEANSSDSCGISVNDSKNQQVERDFARPTSSSMFCPAVPQVEVTENVPGAPTVLNQRNYVRKTNVSSGEEIDPFGFTTGSDLACNNERSCADFSTVGTYPESQSNCASSTVQNNHQLYLLDNQCIVSNFEKTQVMDESMDFTEALTGNIQEGLLRNTEECLIAVDTVKETLTPVYNEKTSKTQSDNGIFMNLCSSAQAKAVPEFTIFDPSKEETHTTSQQIVHIPEAMQSIPDMCENHTEKASMEMESEDFLQAETVPQITTFGRLEEESHTTGQQIVHIPHIVKSPHIFEDCTEKPSVEMESEDFLQVETVVPCGQSFNRLDEESHTTSRQIGDISQTVQSIPVVREHYIEKPSVEIELEDSMQEEAVPQSTRISQLEEESHTTSQQIVHVPQTIQSISDVCEHYTEKPSMEMESKDSLQEGRVSQSTTISQLEKENHTASLQIVHISQTIQSIPDVHKHYTEEVSVEMGSDLRKGFTIKTTDSEDKVRELQGHEKRVASSEINDNPPKRLCISQETECTVELPSNSDIGDNHTLVIPSSRSPSPERSLYDTIPALSSDMWKKKSLISTSGKRKKGNVSGGIFDDSKHVINQSVSCGYSCQQESCVATHLPSLNENFQLSTALPSVSFPKPDEKTCVEFESHEKATHLLVCNPNGHNNESNNMIGLEGCQMADDLLTKNNFDSNHDVANSGSDWRNLHGNKTDDYHVEESVSSDKPCNADASCADETSQQSIAIASRNVEDMFSPSTVKNYELSRSHVFDSDVLRVEDIEIPSETSTFDDSILQNSGGEFPCQTEISPFQSTNKPLKLQDSGNLGVPVVSSNNTSSQKSSKSVNESPKKQCTTKDLIREFEVRYHYLFTTQKENDFWKFSFKYFYLDLNVRLGPPSLPSSHIPGKEGHFVSHINESSRPLLRWARRILMPKLSSNFLREQLHHTQDFLNVLEKICFIIEDNRNFITELMFVAGMKNIKISEDSMTFNIVSSKCPLVFSVEMKLDFLENYTPSHVKIQNILGCASESVVQDIVTSVPKDIRFFRNYIKELNDYKAVLERCHIGGLK